MLMLTATGVAYFLYTQLQSKEENRLCGALAAILSESISKVGFSGKYHTRLLVEQMRSQITELESISVESPDGLVIAHSDPSLNDICVTADELKLSRECLEIKKLVIDEHMHKGKMIKEVVLPYRGGLDAEILGVVRLGINVEEARAEQRANLVKLLILISVLTCAAIFIVFVLSRYFGGTVRELAIQLQGILDNSPALIYMKDRAGRYLFVNRQWAELFHITNEKVRGKTDLEIFSRDIACKFMENDRRVFENGQATELEEQALLDDGIHDYHSIKVALKDNSGIFYALCGISTDITGKKRAEEELLKHREHLEELVKERTAELAVSKENAVAANQAKSLFLANISHELRTPMNAILGFAHIMSRDSGITSKQRENLDIIIKSGEHLLCIINDILDIAKIESGRMESEVSDFDLGELTRDLIDMLRIRAEAKGLRLIMDQSSSFPRFVSTDMARLRQIIINLVGNAIKFTSEGQITIKLGVCSIEQERNKHFLLFEIQDTGIGIDKAEQENIFKPFVQLGQHEGTGLGLAITQQYINLLGGSISVMSEPGKGSKFTFTIAFAPVDDAQIQTSTPSRGRVLEIENACNYKVLIVEDQLDNRLLMRNLLMPFRFDLREAADGREGVHMFEEWRPHIIFIDRRMPVLDGLSAVREMRKAAGPADAVIIAVTAHAFREERQQMIDVGCDAFISKPFSADAIYDVIEKYLKVRVIRAEEETDGRKVREELDPEELLKLPDTLLREMEDALIRLDRKRIDEIIGQVTLNNASLGKKLGQYASRFDYTAILEALQNILGGGQ
ncbi:MAG: hypothetical protein A2008_02440 [Candidatus Wallbacteria bacterium GWC2_49_35]|uniref:histidine kinase n=1 Tax=Candidatus Wallbacteria bacterium GWC2_49_35 TaxID=1817813 RepID=A0A1F7WTL9_9BACT|nr:MAG: hypothetical protein A2008_02440 [Candidatus Wallbacteria bacterium GWC2_49_35]